MATAVKRLGLYAQQCSCRALSQRARTPVSPAPWQRPFSSTSPVLARGPAVKGFSKRLVDNLDSEDLAQFNSLSAEEQQEHQAEWEQSLGSDRFAQQDRSIRGDIDRMIREQDYKFPKIRERPARKKQGFWTMGEEAQDMGPDEEFNEDDISSLAHGELEQHREFREYARLAAWEMPMLSKLVTPFQPPSQAQPLRFRYTSYMGEQHPAANKVVVEFCPADLPDLSPQQRDKLVKLAGARYNPATEIVKISCEMFETQAQNKRYLGDVVGSLMREARDAADDFADVPFDFRHHKPKRALAFPDAWLLTPERKQLLEQRRASTLQLEAQRAEDGEVVDGLEVIEKMLAAPVKETIQLMAAAEQPAPKGKTGKKQVARRMR
ncbi:mitochondrial ribosomal subunit protein-domain-containing protein [Cryomyces antarcticus]